MIRILGFFILALMHQPVLAGEEFSTSASWAYQEDSFFDNLYERIKYRFESSHPINFDTFVKDLKKCNPGKDFMEIDRMRNFTLCLPGYRHVSGYMGFGQSSISNLDLRNREQTLTGSSPYAGGALTYLWRTDTLFTAEGRYWILPNFKSDESAVENLRTSSVFEGVMALQKRIHETDWSFRFGGIAYKVPVAKDNSQTLFAEDAEITLRNTLMGGLFVGLKYAKYRHRNSRHIFKFDAGVVGYSDNRFFNETASSYILKGSYRYFFRMPWALRFDFEGLKFFSKIKEEANVMFFGAGIQLYLF